MIQDTNPSRRLTSLLLFLLLLTQALGAQQAELVQQSQRAKQFMGEGRFAEAAEVYAGLLETLPDNPGLLLNLGMALHLSGQDRKAIPQLERALEIQPGILPALLFLGGSYMAMGQPAKALPRLTEVVRAQPRMPQGRQLLGDALAALGRRAEAAEHYRRWTALEADSPQAWFTLGTTYELLAQDAFEKLAESAPESVYMLALVGEVRIAQRQYSSAFFLYKEALERGGALPGMHAAVAEIYRETGHPEWAEEALAKEASLPSPDCEQQKHACAFLEGSHLATIAAARGDNSPAALYWSARAYNQLAREAFAKLEALPPSVEAHRMRARRFRNQDRHIEAIEEWQAALELVPGDPELRKELGISYHQSRNDEAALEVFEPLVEQRPGSAELNFMMGDTLLSLQRIDAALPYLEKAVEIDGDLLAARSSLGRAYVQSNRGQQAIPHLEAALPLDSDGSLHFQLARAYQLDGRREEAMKLMVRYQEIQKELEAEKLELEKQSEITAP